MLEEEEREVPAWGWGHWLSLGFIVLVVAVLILAPWPALDKLRAIGFTMCPQRPAHSLFIAGVQLPVEARKVGIFLGFLSGLGYMVILGRGKSVELPPGGVLALLLGFIGLMGIDSLNALGYDLGLPFLYMPNNYLRLATGLLNGLAVAAIALPAVNLSLWQWGLEQPTLRGWRELLVGLGLLAVIFAVILWGGALWLYPLAVLSIVGALVVLGTINTLLLVGVIRWPGRITARRQLLPIVAVALLLCSLELAAMGAWRLAMVGTTLL